MLRINKKSVATTTSTDKHTTFKYKVPQILKNCK